MSSETVEFREYGETEIHGVVFDDMRDILDGRTFNWVVKKEDRECDNCGSVWYLHPEKHVIPRGGVSCANCRIGFESFYDIQQTGLEQYHGEVGDDV